MQRLQLQAKCGGLVLISPSKISEFVGIAENFRKKEQSINWRLKSIGASAESMAYNWLTIIHLEEHDFHFEENTFLNILHVQYNVPLKQLPSRCICAVVFDIERRLSCKKGGRITLCYNEARDFTAQQLAEVCHDVRIEARLKSLSVKVLHH